MIRTFLAVEIDEAVTHALLQEVARLKPHFPRINWVKPDNLHLTLKFIGNLPPDDLPELFAAAEQAAAEAEAFPLEVTGVSAFPDLLHPRAVFAGCGEGTAAAIALSGRIEEYVAPLGYPSEARPYHPHFTLGRVKQPADARGLAEFITADKQPVFGTIDVSEIVVFMSELKKHGARHTPMQRIPLRG